MGKKIIAVNWKWEGEICGYKEYLVNDCDDCRVYFTNFTKNDSGHGLPEYKEYINDIFKNADDQVLVLSHRNDETNNISKADLSDIECGKNRLIDDFIGTENCIVYYGHLGDGGFLHILTSFSDYNNKFLKALNEGLPEEEKYNIPKERFDKVWNWYWSQSVLETQKKKLINTFLPLAIDIQGLSQLSNKEKKEQYLKEIIQDINSEGDRIIEEWNEVKKVLAIDNDEDVLSEEYGLNPSQKSKIKFPIERENSSFSKGELIKLFKKDSWLEDEFLPKWLEEAVEILEKKIEGKNNQ